MTYFFQDLLGGEHIATGSTGTVCEDLDTLPFGSLIKYLNNCDNSYQFAGMERDDQISANLDYAIYRYYDWRLGRFLSTDPAPWSADPTDPQSWNGYAYVENSPINWMDPLGLCRDEERPCKKQELWGHGKMLPGVAGGR